MFVIFKTSNKDFVLNTILLPTPSWHDGTKHGTMLRIPEHYLRLHSSCFWLSFKREKHEKSKEITLGLMVFD